MAKYAYDAWGKCTIVEDTSERGIATINPYRYRGYYYDAEIGMCYLQSRYYDPEIGRFVNGDEATFATHLAETICERNLYTYAKNSALVYSDHSGYNATVATYYVVQQMGALAAAGTTLLASVKAFLISIYNIFVVVGLLLIALAAVVVVCRTIGNVYTKIETGVKTKAEKYKKYAGYICVYVLTRKPKNVKSIFYVGRTKNIIARYNSHSRTKGDFYMYVIYTCRNTAESRIVEQCVLTACLAENFTSVVFGQAPSNLIRGVSIKNATKVIDELGDTVAETLSLLSCTSESDLLLMMNQ